MWQVPVVCRRMWRLESQSYPCWKTMTFVLSLSSLSPLNKTRIVLEFVQLERVADFQPCLKWEQCHQHNHSEGFELNPGHWHHLSVQSRICPCHCFKGSTEGDSEYRRGLRLQNVSFPGSAVLKGRTTPPPGQLLSLCANINCGHYWTASMQKQWSKKGACVKGGSWTTHRALQLTMLCTTIHDACTNKGNLRVSCVRFTASRVHVLTMGKERGCIVIHAAWWYQCTAAPASQRDLLPWAPGSLPVASNWKTGSPCSSCRSLTWIVSEDMKYAFF